MLPGGVNGAIQEEIQRGTLLYMIEVSDIDSFMDESVGRTKHLSLGSDWTEVMFGEARPDRNCLGTRG